VCDDLLSQLLRQQILFRVVLGNHTLLFYLSVGLTSLFLKQTIRHQKAPIVRLRLFDNVIPSLYNKGMATTYTTIHTRFRDRNSYSLKGKEKPLRLQRLFDNVFPSLYNIGMATTYTTIHTRFRDRNSYSLKGKKKPLRLQRLFDNVFPQKYCGGDLLSHLLRQYHQLYRA
jgi:hypothetical protein